MESQSIDRNSYRNKNIFSLGREDYQIHTKYEKNKSFTCNAEKHNAHSYCVLFYIGDSALVLATEGKT